ncbi:hypothetical protein [Candidatus Nitrosocosmicus hydrocola]|uniref:hypothetical protein n=1 Tax=Candidatus Nitrosocosmicus hydrocola TaxID=1826872 RepID=UPI0011E5B8B6|nr:hypothetical protein [Candidatus Nitrosocosmicus hydrocola]
MSESEVSLKTPFAVQRFTNIENFIMIVFPKLESYLKEQIARGIQKSNLNGIAYTQLQNNFKLFIVRNYSKELDEYLTNETGHVNKEAMKEVLLSTISITLNVTDEKGNKLIDSDYLDVLRNIIQNLKL